MARLRGLRLLELPTAVHLDRDGELDPWARVADAEGNELSSLDEAKVRLRACEVRARAARLEDPAFRQSLPEQASPDVPGLAFGIRIYAEARDADVAPRQIAA